MLFILFSSSVKIHWRRYDCPQRLLTFSLDNNNHRLRALSLSFAWMESNLPLSFHYLLGSVSVIPCRMGPVPIAINQRLLGEESKMSWKISKVVSFFSPNSLGRRIVVRKFFFFEDSASNISSLKRHVALSLALSSLTLNDLNRPNLCY